MRQMLIPIVILVTACKSPSGGGAAEPTGAAKARQREPNWELSLLPARQNRELKPALLGHYDLSGALLK